MHLQLTGKYFKFRVWTRRYLLFERVFSSRSSPLLIQPQLSLSYASAGVNLGTMFPLLSPIEDAAVTQHKMAFPCLVSVTSAAFVLCEYHYLEASM